MAVDFLTFIEKYPISFVTNSSKLSRGLVTNKQFHTYKYWNKVLNCGDWFCSLHTWFYSTNIYLECKVKNVSAIWHRYDDWQVNVLLLTPIVVSINLQCGMIKWLCKYYHSSFVINWCKHVSVWRRNTQRHINHTVTCESMCACCTDGWKWGVNKS